MLFPRRNQPLKPEELTHRQVSSQAAPQQSSVLIKYGIKNHPKAKRHLLLKRAWYKWWGDPDPSGELGFDKQYDRCKQLIKECRDKGAIDPDSWKEAHIKWKNELSMLLQYSIKVMDTKIDLVKETDRELYGK